MAEYSPSNIKADYETTMCDLEVTFQKWGVRQWQVRPMRDSLHFSHDAEKRRVSVEYEVHGRTVRLSLDRHPYQYQNFRILYLAIEALRMNEVRGLEDVVKDAYLQLNAPRETRDPHEVLGVRPGEPVELIDAAYRAKAKLLHPDRGGSVEQMAELNAAYESLKAPAS